LYTGLVSGTGAKGRAKKIIDKTEWDWEFLQATFLCIFGLGVSVINLVEGFGSVVCKVFIYGYLLIPS